jgi:hypothetical protein
LAAQGRVRDHAGIREHLPVRQNVHLPMVENFVDAIESKSALLASGADSFWTDWIIERALRQKNAA